MARRTTASALTTTAVYALSRARPTPLWCVCVLCVCARARQAHIIDKIEYEYPFTLIVCYNTPRPMDAEAELQAADGTVYESGRSLRVIKVEKSTSKAENLNAALELVETENVIIYDADHHPDPQSLLIATAALEAHGVQCMQGSTYLRTRCAAGGRPPILRPVGRLGTPTARPLPLPLPPLLCSACHR